MRKVIVLLFLTLSLFSISFSVVEAVEDPTIGDCTYSPGDDGYQLCQLAIDLIDDGQVCDESVGPIAKCYYHIAPDTNRAVYCSSDGNAIAANNYGQLQSDLSGDFARERQNCEAYFEDNGVPWDDNYFLGSGVKINAIFTGVYDLEPNSAPGAGVLCDGRSDVDRIVGSAVVSDSGVLNSTASICLSEPADSVNIEYSVTDSSGILTLLGPIQVSKLLTPEGVVDLGVENLSLSNGQINEGFKLKYSISPIKGGVPGAQVRGELTIVSELTNQNQANAVPVAPAGNAAVESSQFGACNCPDVQTNGQAGAQCQVTGYDNPTGEGPACVSCLLQPGNTWVSGLGCLNNTPTGIILQLVRIGLGTMGGVALARLIYLGYLYQFGEEKDIREAGRKAIDTLGAILVILFSVLLLRVIGVNILDVVPPGFFGNN